MAAARALMPVMSDIHLLPSEYLPRLLLLIFKLVNALMVRYISANVGNGDLVFWDRGYSWYSCAYLHSGMAAARALTPLMSDIQSSSS